MVTASTTTDITATTATVSAVLEGLGYEPKTQVLSVPVTYTSLAAGDIDIFLIDYQAPGLDVPLHSRLACQANVIAKTQFFREQFFIGKRFRYSIFILLDKEYPAGRTTCLTATNMGMWNTGS